MSGRLKGTTDIVLSMTFSLYILCELCLGNGGWHMSPELVFALVEIWLKSLQYWFFFYSDNTGHCGPQVQHFKSGDSVCHANWSVSSCVRLTEEGIVRIYTFTLDPFMHHRPLSMSPYDPCLLNTNTAMHQQGPRAAHDCPWLHLTNTLLMNLHAHCSLLITLWCLPHLDAIILHNTYRLSFSIFSY